MCVWPKCFILYYVLSAIFHVYNYVLCGITIFVYIFCANATPYFSMKRIALRDKVLFIPCLFMLRNEVDIVNTLWTGKNLKRDLGERN